MKTAAAPAAAGKIKTVVEFVLYAGSGDTRQGVFSDSDLDIVRARKLREVEAAQLAGRERPQLTMTKRVCTYPLNKAGEAQAQGSTCDETEV